MSEIIKIGIIICDRYRTCSGGKCFRSMKLREGAFSIYRDEEVDLVGYTSCDGCPGGNVEYMADEMIKNGATRIHLATGLIVGYPPCPYITDFHDYLSKKYGLEVIYGTHPIPQKYYDMHKTLGTWDDKGKWDRILAPVLTDENMRQAYN